jgi:nucleoid DNA-binding protein
METINKDKITEMLKLKLGFSRTICEEIVNQIFDNIQYLLEIDQKVAIKNLGTFSINTKNARKGTNFHTQQQVIIPPKKVQSFIPAKQLKNLINQ